MPDILTLPKLYIDRGASQTYTGRFIGRRIVSAQIRRTVAMTIKARKVHSCKGGERKRVRDFNPFLGPFSSSLLATLGTSSILPGRFLSYSRVASVVVGLGPAVPRVANDMSLRHGYWWTINVKSM
jgi:hypothetical protein